MNTLSDKSQENTNQRMVNAASARENSRTSTSRIEDNRAEAVAQRKLQGIAEDSVTTDRTAQMQTKAASSFTNRQQPLQGKINSTIQRVLTPADFKDVPGVMDNDTPEYDPNKKGEQGKWVKTSVGTDQVTCWVEVTLKRYITLHGQYRWCSAWRNWKVNDNTSWTDPQHQESHSDVLPNRNLSPPDPPGENYE
ncbi:MAG: hypothetical protein RIG77_20370 [Cyclobacteriaceae bacterium]